MAILQKVLMGSMLTSIWMVSSSHATDSTYTFSTLAGSPGAVVTSVDGTGPDAQFLTPRGVAVDSAGNVYVADSSNHTIRKVTSAGVTTIFAGTAGTTGTPSDSPARFNEPFAVAVDSAGTVYVTDTNNGAIRKITPAGVVSTLAGGNGQGYVDGTGATAKFAEPQGIALDTGGNIYVADYENNVVRKVTAAGVVTTLAGKYNTPGTDNGQGEAARFMSLRGIAVDSSGNIYVSDGGVRLIRKITATGLVTTFAGGTPGAFGEPRGLAFDSNGNLFVADYSSHVIKKITPAGVISTAYGTSPTPGSSDGTTGALFNAPSGISIDSANNLYVADSANNSIRKISSSGTVTTLAGLAGRSSSRDGVGAAAAFEEPYAVATDGTYVYVADDKDHSIRKISADGTVTTLAGKAGTFGSANGSGSSARFYAPLGIAADSAGNVYVADTGNSTVRKITSAGLVSTLAGTAGSKGSTDGTGAAARFSGPSGVAVDSSGNVFVAEPEQSTLRKITPAGVVTTFAGNAGATGFTDGTGTAARFNIVYDVAIDSADNLYVVDRNNHAIRKVTLAGVVTTLAGSGTMGYAEGKGTAAMFHFPSGVTVDSSGNVYVADTDNQRIRRITPSGDVTTVAGGNIGSTDGAAAVVSFYNPKDVAADFSGNIYVADKNNHAIRKGSPLAATSCTYLLSSYSQSAGVSALTGNLNISTTTGCTWTAASSASWISISSVSSGSGNGSVLYSVAANTGSNSRTGSITVAGQAFTVTQAGASGTGSASIQVVEFYNTSLDNFFITADSGEAMAIDTGSAGPGWSRTGNSFKSGGNTSVCRFYGSQSPGPNSHFYTVDSGECNYLKQLQASTSASEKRWNFESLDFVSTPTTNSTCTAGTTPVYRAYNNGATRGVDSNHRITNSLAAIQEVVNRGWKSEGVVMCAPQ